MDLSQAWDGLLQLTAQVVTPTWADLLQYIPLLLVVLLVVTLAMLAWAWQRGSAANRSRVPPRRPSGRPPEGLHLPSPTPWPFVAPIGLILMLFALAFGFDSLGDLLLLAAGATLGVIGALGWLIDARRDYVRVEAGGHASSTAAALPGATAVLPGASAALLTEGAPAARVELEREPPEGVHLPGPSPWPFLAPIGLIVAILGLIFGPALIVGGLIMGAIASVGWLRDATRELRDIEAVGHVVPVTRDPEKAFPKALGPVYVFVGGVALLITALPFAISLLPGSGGGEAPAGPPPTSAPYLSAQSVAGFDQTEIAVVADQPFRLTFENMQAGVQHNVAIYDTPALGSLIFIGEIFAGPDVRVYDPPPLSAGVYFYLCSVHPQTMTGTLYAR
jgi:hypothetical protein